MNDLHCTRSFVESIAPLNAAVLLILRPYTLSIHRSLGLTLFLFPSNPECCALSGIRPIVILSTCPNHRSLPWTALSSRVVWLPNACLMSSFLILCSLVIPPPKPTHLYCKDPFLVLVSHYPTFRSVPENRLYRRLVYSSYLSCRHLYLSITFFCF